ncbi:MAG: hypothetical protein AAGF24_00020 [Cyanobacteria bacterium P01_H01_bin.121]
MDTRGAEVLSDDPYNVIESIERCGTAYILNQSVLPKGMEWSPFESVGFVRLNDDPGNDLFVSCQFPLGWTKRSSGFVYQIYLIDAGNIKRGYVYYKAAPYDRYATACLFSRFELQRHRTAERTRISIFDRATGEAVHQFPEIPHPGPKCPTSVFRDFRKREDETEQSASSWLDEHYPNWKDSSAYWPETSP